MSAPPDTIHFNQTYMNYRYEWNGFPTILAFVPWIYMFPTLVVICRIIGIYFKTNWEIQEAGKNQHVFLVISLTQISCFSFYIFNFLLVRLPATGLFTSWCASIAPNSGLLLISFLASYTNYLAMIYPFFMPVVRLIIMMHPKNHMRLSYYLFYGSHSIMAYTLLVRPFGNDAQACLVSWIFYKTHPVFNKTTVTNGAFERRVNTA
uniref:Serpentine Receptor, class T n=1 Tax=Caenorhabditis tropicalis TaxID=1561998 RepID=A0A1I7UDD7_9PELO